MQLKKLNCVFMFNPCEMRHLIILLLCYFLCLPVKAQNQPAWNSPGKTKAAKGSIYIGMGFHRAFFTRSNIHFQDEKTANYNFVLHRVKANDDNDFHFGKKGFDAPQYSFRLGYYFNNRANIGIEFNFDHVKYIATKDQKLRISGQINGVKMDKDTILSSSFVQYEHTDGANYYMFNFLKRKKILHSKNEKHRLSVIIKPGLGFVLPKTDSEILGLPRNDKYHLSGYVIGIDVGLRYEFLKHFFAEATVKEAYANYNDVVIYGKGRASQHWWSFQTIAVVGFQFPL